MDVSDIRSGICAITLIAVAGVVQADVIYENDFEGLVGGEWSHTDTSRTPVGDRGFLGEFANDTVSLALASLPAHDRIEIEFDLFVLRTWDGNGEGAMPGPDSWTLSADGSTLINATFAVGPDSQPQRQSFSGSTATGDGDPFAPRTGAVENDTLGYMWNGEARDSVYHISFTFDHADSALTLDFGALGLQDMEDESWGIDNIVITAVPAPGALALLGFGALASRRKR